MMYVGEYVRCWNVNQMIFWSGLLKGNRVYVGGARKQKRLGVMEGWGVRSNIYLCMKIWYNLIKVLKKQRLIRKKKGVCK